MPDFQLFSSLRFDPLLLQSTENKSLWPDVESGPSGLSPFYMLPYHRDRMLQAAQHFGWDKAVSRIQGAEGLKYVLSALESVIDQKETSSLRVRTVLDNNGDVVVETSPTPTVPYTNLFPRSLPAPGSLDSHNEPGAAQRVPKWVLLIDPQRTTPSPYTTYKTTSRDMYTLARERAGIENMADTKEVFIISNQTGEVMEGSLTSVFFWRGGRWVTPPVSSGGQAGTTRRWLLEKG